jgi:glucose/arabinose dehydrogenase
MLIPMLALALTLIGPAAVQEDGQQKPAPTPAPPAAERPRAPEPPGPLPATNVRIELTISISGPGGAPASPPKTATLHVVDRDSGRIRMGHGGTVVVQGQPPQPSPMFNVDAAPHVVANGRIRVNLSFEFRPEWEQAKDVQPIHVNERLSAVLEDGKPMVVSQTTDPASDRVVKVELKATIVK